MPNYRTVAFTMLELKGLWLKATGAQIGDPTLDQAAESAIDKVWRAEKGMSKKPTPPLNPVRGAEIDLTGSGTVAGRLISRMLNNDR